MVSLRRIRFPAVASEGNPCDNSPLIRYPVLSSCGNQRVSQIDRSLRFPRLPSQEFVNVVRMRSAGEPVAYPVESVVNKFSVLVNVGVEDDETRVRNDSGRNLQACLKNALLDAHTLRHPRAILRGDIPAMALRVLGGVPF